MSLKLFPVSRAGSLLALPFVMLAAPAHAQVADWVERGIARVYADEHQGEKTTSGERYDGSEVTAAHPSLPLGIFIRVINEATQQSVDVRVNDRPKDGKTAVQLSHAAAQRIGIIDDREGNVRVQALEKSGNFPKPRTGLAMLPSASGAQSVARNQPATEEVPELILTPVSREAQIAAVAPAPARAKPEPQPEKQVQQKVPASSQGWRVQFGAFSQQTNATALDSLLQKQGLKVEVAKVPGKNLWKVLSAKSFGSSGDAGEWGAEVSERLEMETAVTRW